MLLLWLPVRAYPTKLVCIALLHLRGRVANECRLNLVASLFNSRQTEILSVTSFVSQCYHCSVFSDVFRAVAKETVVV